MSALSDQEISTNKTERLMNTVAMRCAYYRANPQRFVADFFGIQLKLFQMILLWVMMHCDAFYFIAARGLGKTYLVALFACCRCILYPGTKIVACSATFKQGKEIVLKITDDFMQKSPLLRNEISKVSTGQNDCMVAFKNGSFIRVVTATESARGARSNILIIDESRLVNQKIVDTILRPMNAAPRQPGYLRKPKYSHLQEMNKEMYMSSAYYSASEMYQKVKSYAANMLDPTLKYFVCDLPYQLSIKEGLLMREQIENEMSEATFSDISFSMERCGLFYGSAANAIFDFQLLNKRRIIRNSLHSLDYYRTSNLRIPEKQEGELRLLSVDVGLLASRKHDNDASALLIHQALPTESYQYIDNIIYIETQEGLVTEDLGLLVMRWFYQYDCDYIVLDTNGIGLGVADYLMADRYDPVYGLQYQGLDFINSAEMSERCKTRNAEKVIWSIKANAKSNNDMCLLLRAGFQNGYINLLLNDNDVDEQIKSVRGYSKMTDTQKAQLKLPYVQTTFLIDELINLDHDVSGGLIKVREKSGMRKDRYSSLEYGYFVIQELAKELRPDTQQANSLADMLPIRRAKAVGSF